ncbi:MAG TPA: ECF-type sigma factor, partial [Thermoanaerobaculia bacterium]
TLNAELGERGEESGIVALLAIEEALVQLERLDARCGRILHLTCFAGLSRDEIAGLIGISVPTVDRDLRFGRAWLNKVLAGDS